MLNIKRPETYELAKTLAERTGLSLTDAVTLALREKVDALDATRQREIAEKRARLVVLAQKVRETWGEPLPAMAEIDADMYDENGLPK